MQNENLVSQYQQLIWQVGLFWVVVQFLKSLKLKKKKKYFKLPLSTLTTISLLDPQIKDYVLQLPRLHAKIIIKIRSLSQTYNCDYENENVTLKHVREKRLFS